MQEGQKLTLMTGPLKFNALRFSRKPPAAVLTWYGETEVVNIFRIRIVVLKLAWPPVHWENAFTSE